MALYVNINIELFIRVVLLGSGVEVRSHKAYEHDQGIQETVNYSVPYMRKKSSRRLE